LYDVRPENVPNPVLIRPPGHTADIVLYSVVRGLREREREKSSTTGD